MYRISQVLLILRNLELRMHSANPRKHEIKVLKKSFPCRATAIGTSSGHGIIGRSDGLIYMWELSTGIKVGNLHHFKGGYLHIKVYMVEIGKTQTLFMELSCNIINSCLFEKHVKGLNNLITNTSVYLFYRKKSVMYCCR